MNFDKAVEAVIQEAMARGDFENLPGKGKPIDLSAYFETPEELRLAQSMLHNAGMLPAEIELLQEIAVLKELIPALTDEEQKAKYRRTLEEKQLQFNLLIERRMYRGKKK